MILIAFEWILRNEALFEDEMKEEEAKVEPIHPPEQRGGIKKGFLGGCKK